MECCIRLKGHLDASWQEWLAGLIIGHEANGTTLLTGHLPDQAALYGVLATVHRLNLSLLELAVHEEVSPRLGNVPLEACGGAHGDTTRQGRNV